MLNPSSAGWIKKYFSLIDEFEIHLEDYNLKLSPEEFIYGQLQPSGMIYGFQVRFIFLENENTDKWSGEEKFKVLLLESLLIADYAHFGSLSLENIEDSLNRFVDFYEESELEKAKKNWLNFKDLDVYGKLESIIEQRVGIKISLSNRLWTSYLHNSLLFQDIVLYFEYYQTGKPDDIQTKRRKQTLNILMVIAAAASADGIITEEETALYSIFLASSGLKDQDHILAKSYIENKLDLSHLVFEYQMSWLMSRYFLEVAILTVWSDRVVEPEEQKFLEELYQKLEVDEEEFDKSFIAVQTFVIDNADAVPFLRGSNDLDQLLSSAGDKWKKILSRNKDKLALELAQSKELVQLIAKSTTTDLSKEEKKKVKSQFKDLAKSIPAFTLFMLPGGSVIMPFVLKLIPDLVPSAFRSNQIDEEPKN
ncbi:LETM1-related biofilm-associated protein [Paracrocinitomix mangrovi]|uniref:LETM1-related biofilm-associated protein n=1 Tax=Paracrocinitomix mangrovi TaxID=2862509 RepID=UPI001C8F05C2|nr:LETM1-related biofilm-associated protein [Paracrocinitomix mangrovi]UKN00106.1 LETM1-related biofilm-associated protein [Paracrocinitomix mangrovi]